ncbi:hypothetical protein ACFC07_22270 [Streptomyces sp. NPDC056099]|uniref:hypothetical protein n=1 Tax=unclassified Streptomyces TaxID=2593676 RepID=UPI0035DD9EA4
MSVTLAKPTDTPAHGIETADAEAVFITVMQRADGSVCDVEITDIQPAPDEVHPNAPRFTVWTAPLPEYEGDPSDAVKVLDFALNNAYRDDDGHAWSEGERAARAFHNDTTDWRAFLRNVEARVIRAGYLDVHTGVTACQDFGLIVGDEGSEHVIMKWRDGWKWAALDCTDIEGWHMQPGTIAPADASPRQVAAAILTNLACFDLVEYKHLPLRYRAHVWRVTFSLRPRLRRLRNRITRYRRRITVRIPR